MLRDYHFEQSAIGRWQVGHHKPAKPEFCTLDFENPSRLLATISSRAGLTPLGRLAGKITSGSLDGMQHLAILTARAPLRVAPLP